MSAKPTVERVGPLGQAVAEEVRAVAGRKKISGSELARRIGRKQPWLNARMNGKVVIDVDELELIAQGLGVHPLDLMPYREAQEAAATLAARAPLAQLAEQLTLNQRVCDPLPHHPELTPGRVIVLPDRRRRTVRVVPAPLRVEASGHVASPVDLAA